MPEPAQPPLARARDPRIDSLRVVAILAVLVGHAVSVPYGGHPERAPLLWAVTYSLVAAFNVQLFLFLSGWVVRKDADLRWVLGRALRLLVPYLAWTVVQHVAFHREAGLAVLLQTAAHPSTTNALWFLPTLFWCSAAYAALRRSDALLVAVAVAAVFVTPAIDFFDVAKAATMFPFFVAGHFARRLRLDPLPAALLAPVLVAVTWLRPGVGLPWTFPAWYVAWARMAGSLPTVLLQAPLRLARAAVSLSLVAVAMTAAGFRKADSRAGAGQPRSPLRDALHAGWTWLGRNTLGIYLCHLYFLPLYLGRGTFAVLASFTSALAGAAVLTLLLQRSRWTALLFLGCGLRKRAAEAPGGRPPGEAAEGGAAA